MAASRLSVAISSITLTAPRWVRRACLALLLGGTMCTIGCTVETVPYDRHARDIGTVPPGAKVIDEGRRHLVYVAHEPAVAYVVDLDSRNVLMTQPVRPGDRFVFAPEDRKALLNDRTIYRDDALSREHVYRIYADLRLAPREQPARELPPPVAERDRDRYTDRPTSVDPVPTPVPSPLPADPVPSRGLKIPATAESVARGVGRITFTAPRDGEIYVRDNDAKTVVLGSTNIRGGDRFVLDPEHNKGSLEGRNELSVTLAPTHEHEIFYVPYAEK